MSIAVMKIPQDPDMDVDIINLTFGHLYRPNPADFGSIPLTRLKAT
jgi:hypothetical protein